jgi:hypothetical protein
MYNGIPYSGIYLVKPGGWLTEIHRTVTGLSLPACH